MRSTLAVLTLAALPLGAQMHHHDAERLGTVAFPISCNAAAQQSFTRAVALLHSFWYEEAEKAFLETAKRDPQCGMAWWGAAMSNYHQVWPSPYSPAELARGTADAEKAASIGATTPREKAYIDAIATFYRGANARAYEAKMEQLAAAFPNDDEAQIFYALSLIAHGMSMPADKTYTYQKKAAGILNGLLKRHPDHPGIAHYLIHSFDYPALAPLALDAAYAYSKIAPSSPHALHMPSHIFVRLGMWEETIQANLASAKAARDHAAAVHPGTAAFDMLHAYDYLAYAYLQLWDDIKVREMANELANVKALDTENFAGYYALAAVPARLALERRNWKEAAELSVRPKNFPWDRYPYAEAIIHFAKAMGEARRGEPARAKAAVGRLKELLQALLDQKNPYWAGQVDVEIRAAEGWIAHAEGKDDQALALLTSAADLEDSTDKSPVTPGSILPAREMLADFLLETHHPAEALAAYERSLQDSPNRLNGLAGASKAAEAAGDAVKARSYAQRVGKLMEHMPSR